MKCRKLFLAAILLCLFNVAIVFAVPLTSFDNKHNLSNQSNNTIKASGVGGTDQVCIFCHTPHSAVPDTPLWSRGDPSTALFDLYAQKLVISGGLGVDPVGQVARSQYTNADPSAYPNGSSRLCLSCHDGVTAIGLLNDNTTINMLGGTSLNDFVGSTAVIELSTSHPVSFVYDGPVLTDLLNFYGPSSYALPDTALVDTPLDGQNRMQCTTCHDPHNDTRTVIGLPFWRHTSAAAGAEYVDVCNSCHKDALFVPGGPSGDHLLP